VIAGSLGAVPEAPKTCKDVKAKGFDVNAKELSIA